MKNVLKKIGFAALVVMAGGAAAFAATRGGSALPADGSGFCNLLVKMHDVFALLRTLAFVGAAFIIAGWAWGYIKDGKGVDTEDLRKKGTSMLVGFILLFSIGIVLSFFMSAPGMGAIGCVNTLKTW